MFKWMRWMVTALVLSLWVGIAPASAHGWEVTYLEWENTEDVPIGQNMTGYFVTESNDDPLHAAEGYMWLTGGFAASNATVLYGGGMSGELQVTFEWTSSGAPGTWYLISNCVTSASSFATGAAGANASVSSDDSSAQSTPPGPLTMDSGRIVVTSNGGGNVMSGSYGEVSAVAFMGVIGGSGTGAVDALATINYYADNTP